MPHPDHEKNRAAWNELVDVHIDHPEYRSSLLHKGGHTLKKIELDLLGDVAGLDLLHLQCQFGLDTLSWARLGARAVGVDISDRSIEEANRLKAKVGLEAEFVRSDVLELIGKIDRKFDIVITTYGIHCWISDMKRWAEVVAHYLKPGGRFVFIDDHPVKVQFYRPPLGYFDQAAERTPNARDYCDRNFRVSGEMIEWQHPIAEIITVLIEAGLTIRHFQEYPYGYYCEGDGWYSDDGEFWYPPGGPAPYPLMFSLMAVK